MGSSLDSVVVSQRDDAVPITLAIAAGFVVPLKGRRFDLTLIFLSHHCTQLALDGNFCVHRGLVEMGWKATKNQGGKRGRQVV